LRFVRQPLFPKGVTGMYTESNEYRLHVKNALGILSLLMLLAGLGTRTARGHDMAWATPTRARKLKNPVKVSPGGLAAAADIFHENCSPCHGEKGDGDGELAQYIKKVKPSNFTDAMMMSEMTDGELFWKMSEGRPPMPPWKEELTEIQRWQLVNYLRALAPKTLPKRETNTGIRHGRGERTLK
jgi:mono/diheme cytochrome c family protein